MFSCDGSTQTDNNKGDTLTRDSCIQTSFNYRQTHSQLIDSETQTAVIEVQRVPLMDSSSQTALHVTDNSTHMEHVLYQDNSTHMEHVLYQDNSTHMEHVLYQDNSTQYSMARDSISLQTELEGIQNELKIYIKGLETAVQVSVDSSDSCIQVSPQFQTICTQSDLLMTNTGNTDCKEKAIQTHSQIATNVHTQTVIFTNHVCSQTQPHVSDIHTQTNAILRPILIDTPSQTQQPHVTDVHAQTDYILSQLVNKGGDDLEGQVVALQAAVEGLKSQLISEREEHTKRQTELERGWRHMRRSLHDSQVSYVCNLDIHVHCIYN